MNKAEHIHVACAIIQRGGSILAAQRSASMSMPFKWEFPGGKIESGESPEGCLCREIYEELSIEIDLHRNLPPSLYHYPQFSIILYPFVCSIKTGEIIPREHAAIIWLPSEKLCSLDWADADLPVVKSFISQNKVDWQ